MGHEANNLGFKHKATTALCLEQPSSENPYVACSLSISGYDIQALSAATSIYDMYFLMFTGQLPKSAEDRKLLESLMILLSIPGPRHPASRAAMTCGISKSNPEHMLPISLMTLGGNQLGAAEVQHSYEFIKSHLNENIDALVERLMIDRKDPHHHIAPGFGQQYGVQDPLTQSFLEQLAKIKTDAKVLSWVVAFNQQLQQHNLGILDIGLAAAVFCELSFGARESVGLYQLLRAPGLLAYAMEQSHKPVTAMPMLENEQYDYCAKKHP